MMSQHLNSMLEHLKMGSLMNKGKNNPGNGSVTNHIGNGFNNNNNASLGNNNNNNSVTGVKSPESNDPVVNDGSTLFLEHRAEAAKPMMGSKVATTNDQVANNQQNKSNNMAATLLSSDTGHAPVSSGKYDPARKRSSISVHSQHNHPHSGAGVNSSNGDAIRPGGGGGLRELSPQSLRIHRKSSHDIRILGADGEMLLHEAGGGKMPTVVKPIKLKSICTRAESYDTLHGRATDVSTI